MARACRWEVQTLYRGLWQSGGCYKSKKAAQAGALERQADTKRDVSVVRRNADGSIHWRKLKRSVGDW